MAVNKFWASTNKNKSDVTKAYVDRYFINLAVTLSTKVTKSGERFTGNIDLGINKIMSSHLDQTKNDCKYQIS